MGIENKPLFFSVLAIMIILIIYMMIMIGLTASQTKDAVAKTLKVTESRAAAKAKYNVV